MNSQQVKEFRVAALQRLLARFGNQGIVIGGVAASLLGRPRLTADVDALLLLSIEELPLVVIGFCSCATRIAASMLTLPFRHPGDY